MNKNEGFTLLEVLIALAVFAILSTITASAMYHAFSTRTRVSEQAERLVTLQLAITLIERDTQQMINRAIRSNEMALLPAFIGQKNYLEMTRGGVINPNSSEKRSTLKRMALLCQNNQLIRRSWAVLDSNQRKSYVDKVLLTDLSECRFAYLNDSLQVLPEWLASSLPQNNQSPSLPKAIQLSLKMEHWGKASFLFIIPTGLYAKI